MTDQKPNSPSSPDSAEDESLFFQSKNFEDFEDEEEEDEFANGIKMNCFSGQRTIFIPSKDGKKDKAKNSDKLTSKGGFKSFQQFGAMKKG